MKSLVADLHMECAALDEFMMGLPAAAWDQVTPFEGWSVRDQIMHLHQVDMFGMASLTSPEAFAIEKQGLRDHQARGIEMSGYARLQYGDLDNTALYHQWRTTWQQMCDRLGALQPDARLPWFGPPMSARSFASARQMEVWAHGQDIHDLFGQTRRESDRIRNICHLGVTTFGWTFVNRKLEVPPVKVRVELAAPSGAEWRWNEDSDNENSVKGSAVDFALVVTQRRNVSDTKLVVKGDSAKQWLNMAQCFAGAPADPPAPGVRI